MARAGEGAARLGDRARAGPRRLRPALLQVVRRRAPECLGPVPRPPRAGRPRRARRLPLARRGGRDARRHLRRAPCRGAALRQRPQGPRRAEGRRGRDLPADDPRGRRRDAGLRPDRRPPQRRLRRLQRRVGGRADVVQSGQGPGHRRRRPPQGQDGADQADGRPAPGSGREPGDDRRRPPHADRLPDEGGPRRLLRRGHGAGRPRVRGRADGGRAPALHPLHLRLDREAEGDPPHHRRLHDRGHRDPPLRLRPEAGGGRLLVRGGRRLGHRPLLHRLRPARQRCDQRDVGGGARLPPQGDLVGADPGTTG